MGINLGQLLSEFNTRFFNSNSEIEKIPDISNSETNNAFSAVSNDGKISDDEKNSPAVGENYEKALDFLVYSDTSKTPEINDDEADYFKYLDGNADSFSVDDLQIAREYGSAVAQMSNIDENSELYKDFSSALENDDFSNLITTAVENELTYDIETEQFSFDKQTADGKVRTLYDVKGHEVSNDAQIEQIAQNNETSEVQQNDIAQEAEQNDETQETEQNDEADNPAQANEINNDSQNSSADYKVVKVVKWEAGSRDNNCLENIIRNNYDLDAMGISLYSKEYLELEKAVMDLNPEIYGDEDKGIEGRKRIIDGTRHNSVLYVDDEIKLPNFNSVQNDEAQQTSQSDETQ